MKYISKTLSLTAKSTKTKMRIGYGALFKGDY